MQTAGEMTAKAQSAAASVAEEKPKSLLAKFKDGLRKTGQFLNTDIRDLFKSEGRLVDDDFLWRRCSRS